MIEVHIRVEADGDEVDVVVRSARGSSDGGGAIEAKCRLLDRAYAAAAAASRGGR